jgi:hypothetical protein
MQEIPGRDGYGGFINDTLFNDVVYNYQNNIKTGPLNAAYYHRWYQVSSRGALGRKTRHRGFSDENLFVAQTTDPKVAGLSLENCKSEIFIIGICIVCETNNITYLCAVLS